MFFMGMSVGFVDKVGSKVLGIVDYCGVSIRVILVCNIGGVMWVEGGVGWGKEDEEEKVGWGIGMGVEWVKVWGVVVIGFGIGVSGVGLLEEAREGRE